MSSLLEISAKIVAKEYNFSSIEAHYPLVPYPILKRIIYFSFPRDESQICMYSSLSNEFDRGVKLYENNAVKNVLQVGEFLLS